MPWDALLETGRGEQLVTQARWGARPGATAPLPEGLHPAVTEGAASAGIETLWSHQAEALEAAQRGHVIVTSGTASGKSLAFNLPVLHTLAGDPSARALYLYPTKALAQDQARKLSQLGGKFLRHAIYDGDTPRDERRAIRQRSNLILTNPDMLHVGVLPNHRSWGDVLANLAFVVVDEAHVYRGVFGSHVANVLRRLRRLARAYGSEPRFVLTSATIANPGELAERLTGLDFELVDSDGAPSGRAAGGDLEPPAGGRALGPAGFRAVGGGRAAGGLVEEEVRTICFLKSSPRSRADPEVHAACGWRTPAGSDLAELIAPYRAGYTAPQRRDIERRLADGDLLAVVATDALELGIDVGDLDAAMCVTFPGTVASLRQMWGRAGRRDTGLALYVAGDDALDQFFCRHPDEFLDRPVESAILDHESEEVHLAHLLAAAYEMPLTPRRRRHARPALGGVRRAPREAGRAARARRALPAARRRTTPPRGSRCARPRPTRWPWWRRPAAR